MTTPKWIPGHLYLTDDLVQPISAAAAASTVLTNPGFESGVITGWTVTTSGAGTSSVASDKKYAGTYAGRWQGVSGGASADWVNATEVPVKPGQSVSAAMYVSMDDTGSSANQARARLYWYDASHVALTGTPHTDGLLIHGNTSAWYTSPVTGVAPAGAAYARMGVWTTANASGGVRVDNASWSIVAAATPAGLIYKATQTGPGTSGSDEPAWPSTVGATVTDNTVTWEGVQASRVVWEASPICQSGATEPAWPTDVGGFVTDGTISWECISRRVEDEKCPNSAVVAIMAGKVFAADGDIVRFSATANPLNWSDPDDAGYLPTGLQQANANDMAVLNQYRSNLVAFNASSFQNWQADPDPAAMAILDQMDGIGSTWQHAAQPVANDLFFLSQLGVRSVGIAAGADNLSAGDIGMPIDVLVRDAVRVALANSTNPLATYYPGAGQYWLAFSHYPPDELVIPGAIDIGLGGDVPDGQVGDTGTYQYTTAGGVLPHTLAIVSGSLPPGATMNSAGLVTYTYTTVGSYAWTVRVTDADGNTADLGDTATVGAPVLGGLIAEITLPDDVRSAYTQATASGVMAYTALNQVVAAADIATRQYDNALVAGTVGAITNAGDGPGDARLWPRGGDVSGGWHLSADDVYGNMELYQGGMFKAKLAPTTGTAAGWWYFEQNYNPEFGGLVWYYGSSVYVGVRQTDGGTFKSIYRWPLAASGTQVGADQTAANVVAVAADLFMHQDRDGNVRVIDKGAATLKTYDANLTLLSTVAIPVSLTGFRGFGVDRGLIVMVGADEVSGYYSDWTLQGTVALATVATPYLTRVTFNDDAVFVQRGLLLASLAITG